MKIRSARPSDVAAMHAMIKELATYEREPEAVTGTPQDLERALFTSAPHLFADVAVNDDDQPIGMAIWFYNYSTWLGKHGIYLEDLYVSPAARGEGVGEALLQNLARRCVAEGLGRLEWWVLRWNNEPESSAGRLYARIGAVAMDDWVPMRLTGAALSNLGAD